MCANSSRGLSALPQAAYARNVARGRRTELPDGFFHAIGRGAGGIAIYRDRDDRRLFTQLFVDVARRFAWEPYAICQMTTHYHAVVEASRAHLSDGMQSLNGDYAAAFNAKHGRRGHLFGDRFASIVIEDDEQLAHAARYVALNPVRAGLCERAADWPWTWCRYGLDDL